MYGVRTPRQDSVRNGRLKRLERERPDSLPPWPNVRRRRTLPSAENKPCHAAGWGFANDWPSIFFSELYASTVREHRLDTLFWECTLRCNLSCRHCGSDCRVDPGVADMPLADFLKVLDEEVTPPRRSRRRAGHLLGRRGARPRGPGGGGRRGHAPRLPVGHGDQRHGPDPGTFRPSARRGAEIGFGEPRRVRARTQLYPRQSPQLRPRAGGRADDRARTLAVVRRGHLRAGAMVRSWRPSATCCFRGGAPLAALLDFPDGACQERPDAADDRRPVPGDAGVHPPHAAGGPDRGQLCLAKASLGGYEAEVRDHFYQCAAGVFGLSVSTGPFRGAVVRATSVAASVSTGPFGGASSHHRETSTGIDSGTCGRTASNPRPANGRAGGECADCSMFPLLPGRRHALRATTAKGSTATTTGCDRSEMVRIAPPDQVFVVFARIGLPVTVITIQWSAMPVTWRVHVSH